MCCSTCLGLILQTDNRTFQQSNLLPLGACFLQPLQREWQHAPPVEKLPDLLDLPGAGFDTSSFNVLRRQLPCTNWLACTAYALQGQTVSGPLTYKYVPL